MSRGGGGGTVVEILAPIALDALTQAAAALLSGNFYADQRRTTRLVANDAGDLLSQDTWQYCESNFASTYGYYYQGLRSLPAAGGLAVAANEDIIVWDSQHGISNIQAYLQAEFKDSITPRDSIEVANNLAELFADRFKEESLSWTPFVKRFNLPSGMVVDCYMLTAAAHDVNDQLAGVASFCWVAYSPPKPA